MYLDRELHPGPPNTRGGVASHPAASTQGGAINGPASFRAAARRPNVSHRPQGTIQSGGAREKGPVAKPMVLSQSKQGKVRFVNEPKPRAKSEEKAKRQGKAVSGQISATSTATATADAHAIVAPNYSEPPLLFEFILASIAGRNAEAIIGDAEERYVRMAKRNVRRARWLYRAYVIRDLIGLLPGLSMRILFLHKLGL